MQFIYGAEIQKLTEILPEIADWFTEAGSPYTDWFWGSAAEARSRTAAMTRDPFSELAASRSVILIDGKKHLGAYVALDAPTLAACRKVDLRNVLNAAKGPAGIELIRRLPATRELFVPMEERDYYLSRIGVAKEGRRRGIGGHLLRHFIHNGATGNYLRLRLDVWSENKGAIEFYLGHGFRVLQKTHSEMAGMSYLAMVRNIEPGLEGDKLTTNY